jgi:hypothetical protein
MVTLEDAVRFSFSVSINVAYQPRKSATLLYRALLVEGRPLTRLDRSAETGGAISAGKVSDAEVVAGAELESVEVTLPAFLLARESGFFKAALTTGPEETHSRVIRYKAADSKGEL